MRSFLIKHVIWQNTSYKLQVASYYSRVESLQARVEIQKCELNPRVTTSNLGVTNLNPRVTSSYLRVTS